MKGKVEIQPVYRKSWKDVHTQPVTWKAVVRVGGKGEVKVQGDF